MADLEFDYLSSQRLVLRRFQESDLPVFCKYRTDPQIARYQSWTTFSEEEGRRFFDEQSKLHPDIPGTWFQIAIVLTGTGELIGDCALHALQEHPQQAEIGFTLSPTHQRNGYATEAVRCLLDYVFRRLRKHRVVAITDARNDAAARVLARVGMRREGHFLQNVRFKGAWGDEFLFALLRQEWLERTKLENSKPGPIPAWQT